MQTQDHTVLPMKLLALLLVASAFETEAKSNCSNAGLTLVQKRHVSSKLHPNVDAEKIWAGKAVRFRTLDGKYLRCDRKVSISEVGSDFVLQKPGAAELHSGDAVTLSCAGRQLSVLQDKIHISSKGPNGRNLHFAAAARRRISTRK